MGVLSLVRTGYEAREESRVTDNECFTYLDTTTNRLTLPFPRL